MKVHPAMLLKTQEGGKRAPINHASYAEIHTLRDNRTEAGNLMKGKVFIEQSATEREMKRPKCQAIQEQCPVMSDQ